MTVKKNYTVSKFIVKKIHPSHSKYKNKIKIIKIDIVSALLFSFLKLTVQTYVKFRLKKLFFVV